jgi:hypothetical protein
MVEFLFYLGLVFGEKSTQKKLQEMWREIQSNIAFFSKSRIRQDACDVCFDFCILFNIFSSIFND